LREEQKLRVFESGMLGKILGLKTDEVTGEFGRLHNVELYDLCSSPTSKARGMRWAVQVAYMGRGEVHAGFWSGNLRERDHLVDLGMDGRIILKCFVKK